MTMKSLTIAIIATVLSLNLIACGKSEEEKRIERSKQLQKKMHQPR